MKNLSKRGFTLVELLVVVAIIGLLSTIAAVSLGTARQKARDTTRIATMKQTATALEQFYADKGGYPPVVAITSTYYVGGKVLCATSGTRTNATDIQSSSCTGTAYTSIPAYPTPVPGGGTTLGTCVTGTTFASLTNANANASYCYGADTAWVDTTTYATAYIILWQLESASNNPLGGSKCQTSNSGVICS